MNCSEESLELMNQESIATLYKELLRLSMILQHVAIHSGYSDENYAELTERSVMWAEKEMLRLRNEAGLL